MDGISLQALADDVQRRLKPEKYLHVLGVTHTAVALAIRHGADPIQAAAAALLHDVSKDMPLSEIESDMKRRGEPIGEEDRPFPAIWHGLHAAARARQDYGWTEVDGVSAIAEAVRLHSTGGAKMGTLAKILFLADALEPLRDYEGIEPMRRLARENMQEGFRQTLIQKCRHIESRGKQLNLRAKQALAEFNERSQPD